MCAGVVRDKTCIGSTKTGIPKKNSLFGDLSEKCHNFEKRGSRAGRTLPTTTQARRV